MVYKKGAFVAGQMQMVINAGKSSIVSSRTLRVSNRAMPGWKRG